MTIMTINARVLILRAARLKVRLDLDFIRIVLSSLVGFWRGSVMPQCSHVNRGPLTGNVKVGRTGVCLCIGKSIANQQC